MSDGSVSSEPTYEVWHFDGKRPELLAGELPDKGACRRVWRNSRHAVITQGGLVLEPKPSCGEGQARAMKSAVAEAHRAATGAAPVAAFIGAPGGDGNRRIERQQGAVRALDERPAAPVEPMPAPPRAWAVEVIPEVEVTARPFDEEPAPAVVVTRRARPAVEPSTVPETTMPSTATTCPCGEPSAPTRGANGSGRPGTPAFAHLCKAHRVSAVNRRRTKDLSPDAALAEVLATITGDPSPTPRGGSSRAKPSPSKAPATKAAPSKPSPAAKPVAVAVEAPVADLLAVVRRQRAVVDALGGLDQAEAVAAAARRVGGPAALVDLVAELAGA